MEKLKPYPFCGNVEPLVVVDDETGLYGVYCYKCEAAINKVFLERADAEDEWNRRVKE